MVNWCSDETDIVQHEEHNYLECTERNNWACPVENLHSDVKWCEMVVVCQASVYIQYVERGGYTIPAQGYKFVYEPSNLHGVFKSVQTQITIQIRTITMKY